jgi:hypothetical protein
MCFLELALFDAQAQHLTGLALGENLERAAANLAISRKPLAGDARVENEIKLLAAIRTLDGCRTFHTSV